MAQGVHDGPGISPAGCDAPLRRCKLVAPRVNAVHSRARAASASPSARATAERGTRPWVVLIPEAARALILRRRASTGGPPRDVAWRDVRLAAPGLCRLPC